MLFALVLLQATIVNQSDVDVTVQSDIDVAVQSDVDVTVQSALLTVTVAVMTRRAMAATVTGTLALRQVSNSSESSNSSSS